MVLGGIGRRRTSMKDGWKKGDREGNAGKVWEKGMVKCMPGVE